LRKNKIIIIIKSYTLNSGNARRDDKIVSTVKDKGKIQSEKSVTLTECLK